MLMAEKKKENEEVEGEEIEEEEVEEESQPREEQRNVSIKGVSKELYKRINDIAHETGKTMGEITNDAYKVFASTIDGAKTVSKSFISGAKESSFQVVSDLKELDINKEDLMDFKKKVQFRNIEKLTLEDVSTEDIENKIQSFVHIGELTVPHEVKKVAILVRSSFVSKITQK